jgi:hypothetical protein
MGVGLASAMELGLVKDRREMRRVVGFLPAVRKAASEESFASVSSPKEEV